MYSRSDRTALTHTPGLFLCLYPFYLLPLLSPSLAPFPVCVSVCVCGCGSSSSNVAHLILISPSASTYITPASSLLQCQIIFGPVRWSHCAFNIKLMCLVSSCAGVSLCTYAPVCFFALHKPSAPIRSVPARPLLGISPRRLGSAPPVCPSGFLTYTRRSPPHCKINICSLKRTVFDLCVWVCRKIRLYNDQPFKWLHDQWCRHL